MRCLACNCVLSDFEATRKYASSGEYVDLCNRHFADIKDEVPVVENSSLSKEVDEDLGDDEFNDWLDDSEEEFNED